MNQTNDKTVAHQAADIADRVKSAAQDAGGCIRDAAHKVRETAGQVIDAAASTFEGASEFARSSLNHGRTRARLWKNDVADSIRENPKTSLLVAVALGAVVGAWWKRK